MSTLTLDEFKNRLQKYIGDILEIPSSFDVNRDYLGHLSNDEFVKAFKEYRDLMVVMYQEALSNCAIYGYTLYDKNTKEEKLYSDYSSNLTYIEKIIHIHHFLVRICESSIYNDGYLEVDVSKLLDIISVFPKIKNPDLLISRLIEHGFIFKGYNKKLKNSSSLFVTHQNDDLLYVIKQYSQSKYAKNGMEFDYAHFNYKLLTINKSENLKIEDLVIYKKLNDQSRIFLSEFNKKMNEQGYYYGDGPTSGLCWGYGQLAYSKDPSKKKNYICRLYLREVSVAIRLYLKNVDAYSNYISKAPNYIKDAFTNEFGKCHLCKEVCSHRKTYMIDNVTYNKCDGIIFEFYNQNINSILFYITLIELSKNSKSRKVLNH